MVPEEQKEQKMDLVTIRNGRYSTGKDTFRDIVNVQFPLIDATIAHNDKGNYIQVDGTPVRGYPKRAFKVFINDANDFQLSTGELQAPESKPRAPVVGVRSPTQLAVAAFQTAESAQWELVESDDKIKARIAERFDIMDEMIQSAADGEVRGVVVTGPPGVGKSHGVAKALRNSIELPQLEAILSWDSESGQPKPVVDKKRNEEDIEQRFKFVSGHCTPLKLFEILYEGKEPNMVTVFDDCDGVLRNEDSLNLFKVALNTVAEKRIMTWNSTRERADVPNRFEFQGSIVVITNINFENPEKASPALAEHLKAIMDRVYYIDLAITNVREKYLHIEGVCKDHDLLKNMGLGPVQIEEVMGFFKANLEYFREVSIRTVQKIGKLCLKHENWWRMAVITTFKSISIIDYDRTISRKEIEAAAATEVVAQFDKNAPYEATAQTMAQTEAQNESNG
jgi:hypothetical protein